MTRACGGTKKIRTLMGSNRYSREGGGQHTQIAGMMMEGTGEKVGLEKQKERKAKMI